LSLEDLSQAVSLRPYLARYFFHMERDSTLDLMPLAYELRMFGAKALKPPDTHAKLKSRSFRVARARLLPWLMELSAPDQHNGTLKVSRRSQILSEVQTTYVALVIKLGADVIELIEHMRFGDADRYEFANVGHDKVVDDLATHDDDLGLRLFQRVQCHLIACFLDLWAILLEVWAVKLV
jgi:hypothetical protein